MPTTSEQIELLSRLERERVTASRDRDITSLTAMLHDDFVFVHSNGRVDSRADYLDLLASGNLVYISMESRDVDVRSAGESVGTVLSRIDLVADYQGNRLIISALVLTVWLRGEGGWQALSIQSTPVAPDR
jgi:hypothetical protein